ncbi:efflux RND transporter permease subunit [Hydrogenovibrio marinus]|uniref:Cytochrome C peroxidase n=1 Tax=Hydrogenovibrio marinus TaxID=28885 RepID=A0A066ZN78_HYDMR|nr:CusA/CzcA family heavy metal efflux RND transporter [Hydrogenovibrio marinus]KDN95258.1 cytochrome C peroxidase [Hydrogenovibrio marinus]BBN59735.1 cation efflux system protein [Hydrogenovibrio marinus]
MLSRLIQFFLTQRMMVVLIIFSITAGGWVAFKNTPIDAFPEVSPTQVKMIFKAPGMTPSEVEQRIITPIEMEMLGLPNQKLLRSMGKYSIADITIDFKEGTDIYWARQQVAEKLNGITLPEGVTGGISPLSTPLGDIFMFTIDGNTLNNQEKRTLLDWVIRPALRSVQGVADVNSLGGEVKVYSVEPNFTKLQAYKIPLEKLIAAVKANNRNDGAGRLNQGEEVLLVRTQGNLTSVKDIENTVVAYQNEYPVKVKDVAKVRIDSLYRNGAVTDSGKGEAVQGLVIALRGANAKQVVESVQKRLDELKPSLPKGISLSVFYNRSALVDKAISTVSSALIEAVILVVLVLVVFLGNLRAAITVSLILPMAALMTFILMNTFGLSANLMSLGGLAIAVGMLVDAAVVVVENIVTMQEKDKANLPKLHLIYRALQEVSIPVVSGILIIMTVFLPLLTLTGLEGKLFVPVALTIIFALGSSLILSLTVIPTLASFILGKPSHKEPWLIRKLTNFYRPVLEWSLIHDRIVIGSAIGALVIAGVVYTQVGKTFMPTMDEGGLILQVEKTPAIGLKETVKLDLRIQREIMKQVPEVKRIVARVGSDELGLDPMSLNNTDTYLVLKPKSEWRVKTKEELISEIRRVMEENFPGFNFAFTQPIQMRVDEMLTGARGDLAIKIFGDDTQTLNHAAEQLVNLVKKIPGATDVYTPQNDGLRYLKLTVNRVMAGRLGLTVEQVQDILRVEVNGLPVGIIYEGIRQVPLIIRGPDAYKSSKQEMLKQPIALPNGESVQLGQLVNAEEIEGPVSIKREQSKRFSTVVANVTGRDLVSFVEEAKQVAKQVALPPGYYFEWGGQFENQQRAAAKLAVVVPIALVLIFIILFSTFQSVSQAVMVLTNVPFALIGGILALWMTGQYLSVPASVGFIALLGIAVLNGVVMISYFNQLAAKIDDAKTIVVEGALRRLRPVLMTASIAALGLVPLVFATGPGSEIQKPLAIVVIGGLISSTLLTLLILPIIYQRFGLKSLSAKSVSNKEQE